MTVTTIEEVPHPLVIFVFLVALLPFIFLVAQLI
jgi:hypothetical protein